MKVLIVDDEPNILDIVEAYLAAKKYQVYRAESGAEALEKFHAFHPDLIVLDLMLPDMTGGDVCTKIREESNVPIIMLTARSSEKDILSGLRIGADDYMVKPFSPKELVARVETVLRRATPADAEEKWSFDGGELVIHPKTKQVFTRQQEVALTATEYELLTLLAKNPSRLFTREELLESVKGLDFEGLDRVIDTHIKNIRQKIEPEPKQPTYILTVRGSGYRFGGKR